MDLGAHSPYTLECQNAVLAAPAPGATHPGSHLWPGSNSQFSRKRDSMYHWRERLFGALNGKRFVRIISPLVGMVVLVGFLASNVSADTTPTTYYACVNMKTGSIYMVNAGDTCQKGYTPMSWNQVGPQGPQGSAGPTGSQGPQGPQGPAGPTQTLTITQVFSDVLVPPGYLSYTEAVCPTGTLLTGGGFDTGDQPKLELIRSYPDSNRNGWFVEAFDSSSDSVFLSAYALCASLA